MISDRKFKAGGGGALGSMDGETDLKTTIKTKMIHTLPPGLAV